MASDFIPSMILNLSLVLVTAALAIADRESTDHSHQQHMEGGIHNREFDHEAILGSVDANREFENLSPEEAKSRLKVILDKMDVDSDDHLTKEEITEWVIQSFQSLNEEEAGEKMTDIDSDKDGQITWPEYLKSTFSYSPDQVDELAQDKNPEIRSFIEIVKDDEAKFVLADVNQDGRLDRSEFSSFLHPYNHQHMHVYETDRMLRIHDANHDGVIDFKEYLGEAKPDKEQLIVEREQFSYYDQDGDGKLNPEEIRIWVLPEDRGVAEEEAEHLIMESDANNDGILTKAEIIEKYDLWVGSAATNYGQHLHDPAEL
ncbi:hypothetical protein CAPTEDRAFT_186176 [Capitella teleta]|uniref:Reticulocalbin-3 n=1 Tax=Capitella teleta TaxID=283909 RepID=R7UK21_CAPTE|nr:hypothetical protein CAPTEDRAFT_186176 [Capitella teleta]|eukprot:ELU03622.1 hypothetical protein CAPTEDRAFT_186176 [Capitella teleta]